MTIYDSLFINKLSSLKAEGRYRVFADLERKVGQFPIATNHYNNKKRDVIVWCSNDYLGQGQNRIILNAMHTAIDQHGAGAGGTRNIAGTNHEHVLLEKELADLHNKDGALLFSSGWVANMTTLSTLGKLTPDLLIFSDEI